MRDQHDDFAREPVGETSLRPWWYLLTIELGVLISIPMFVIGGQLGFSLSLQDLLIATIVGGAILGILGAATARIGANTRCSTALLARSTFGSHGGICIGTLLALGMTGWWAVQTALFADSVVRLAESLFHLQVSREFMVLAGGCAMITTAALGIKAIGRLAYLAVPLLAVSVCYGMYSMIASHGLPRALSYHPSHADAVGVGSAIATVVGGWIVGASMNPDFARFARNSKHAVAYAVGHYSINYPLLLIICGVMAIGFQSKDLLIHIVPPGFSWMLFLLMMLATWAANDCNLYSSSLGLTLVIPRLKRSTLAIIGGAIGITLAELGLADHLVSFLILLGVLIAPVSGVLIVGAIDPRNQDRDGMISLPDWRAGPLLAWIGGALIGYLTTPKQALGLGAFSITTVPPMDAVIAAAAIMFAIKCLKREQRPSTMPTPVMADGKTPSTPIR